MSVPPDLIEVTDEPHHGFKALIAVAIAVGTLTGAGVGYLQATAADKDDEHAGEARRLSIQAMAEGTRALERAYGRLLGWSQAEAHDVLAGNARRFAREPAVAPGERRRFAVRAAQRELAARRVRAHSGITGRFGPQRDPDFPLRLIETSAQRSEVLWARQDAAREASAAWSKRAAAYLAVLAILAVSIYLFGLSLTLDDEPMRRVVAGVGVAMVVIAAGWAATRAFSRPPATTDRAAEAYAAGLVATRTGSHASAVRLFTEAIEARPSFASAYEQRADARFNANSKQLEGILSHTNPGALPDIVADREEGIARGRRTAAAYGNLGFEYFLQALWERRGGDPRDEGLFAPWKRRVDLLEESIAATRQALRLRPDAPVQRFNLGVALLASGRPREARAAYRRGIADTDLLATDVVSGALSDLELVAARRPALRPAVKEMKELVVGSFTNRAAADDGERPRSRSSGRVSRLRLDVTPSVLRTTVSFADVDPYCAPDESETQATARCDVIAIYWYRRDAKWGAWTALPSVSGRVPSLPDRMYGDQVLIGKQSFVALARRCVPSGLYRAEVFVNGRLAKSAPITATLPDLNPVVDPLSGVAMCVPAGWTSTRGSRPGYSTIRGAPDGAEWAGIFRHPAVATASTATYADRRARSVVRGGTGNVEPVERPSRVPGFMQLPRAAVRTYVGRGAGALVGVGESNDGDLIVGVAAGPRPLELAPIFASFVETDPLPTGPRRNRLAEFRRRLVRALPRSWFDDSEARQLRFLARDRSANLLGSSEPIAPELDARDVADANTHLFESDPDFQDFRVLWTRPVELDGGGLGFLRRFQWTPKDSSRVDQLQLYYVEGTRAYYFTATSTVADFPRWRASIFRIFDAILRCGAPATRGC